MRWQIFLILLIMVPAAHALEEGYPFIGRLIDTGQNPVDAELILAVGNCQSTPIITNNGEFILTINSQSDFTEGGLPCTSRIQAGDPLVIKVKVGDCDIEMEGSVQDSATLLGTLLVEDCIAQVTPEYKPMIPAAGGSGGGGSGGAPQSDAPLSDEHVAVMVPEDVQDFVDTKKAEIIKEKFPQAAPPQSVLPEPESPLVTIDKEKISSILIHSSLLLIIIANIIWLISQLKR